MEKCFLALQITGSECCIHELAGYPRCAAEVTVHFMVNGAGLQNIWFAPSDFETVGAREGHTNERYYIIYLDICMVFENCGR